MDGLLHPSDMEGTHAETIEHITQELGSSPLTRGTRVVERLEVHAHGIIPACAGNTFHSFPFGLAPWDHPRLRGEHFAERIFGARRGIIPAYAGNT